MIDWRRVRTFDQEWSSDLWSERANHLAIAHRREIRQKCVFYRIFPGVPFLDAENCADSESEGIFQIPLTEIFKI